MSLNFALICYLRVNAGTKMNHFLCFSFSKAFDLDGELLLLLISYIATSVPLFHYPI